MKNKQTSKKTEIIEEEITAEQAERKCQSDDLFKRMQENNPTMTLDEIGDFFLNKYLYKRKFKMPN